MYICKYILPDLINEKQNIQQWQNNSNFEYQNHEKSQNRYSSNKH
jgi:hypothetical protein